ncbi:hypothetical protein [Synechococcus sp. M16CYN]|uniref:hypothetical protein n=1 Tax=Synechococcus sp. M16CYN TaxID=3103139 RepID=UPI0030DE2C97
MGGWILNDGDPAWGRLSVPGQDFPMPEVFTWVYILPPLAILVLTQWGFPVSTSFLMLSTFQFSNILELIQISLTGYILAFGIGLGTYSFSLWMLEWWVFYSSQNGQVVGFVWVVWQWLGTGFLWSMWLIQDLASVFVFLPRELDLVPMVTCSLLLCLRLSLLIVTDGSPVHALLRLKTNTFDVRSVIMIDLLFGLCLLCMASLSTFPLSTTWVFLGLIGGREIALRINQQQYDSNLINPEGGCFIQAVGGDLCKAGTGLLLSILIALSLQLLI